MKTEMFRRVPTQITNYEAYTGPTWSMTPPIERCIPRPAQKYDIATEDIERWNFVS